MWWNFILFISSQVMSYSKLTEYSHRGVNTQYYSYCYSYYNCSKGLVLPRGHLSEFWSLLWLNLGLIRMHFCVVVLNLFPFGLCGRISHFWFDIAHVKLYNVWVFVRVRRQRLALQTSTLWVAYYLHEKLVCTD